MDEPQIILFVGDPYRCERALAEREGAIFAGDRGGERHTLYGDELDPKRLEIELRSDSLFNERRHFVIRRVDGIQAEAPLATLIARGIPTGTFLTLIATALKGKSPILKACKENGSYVPLPSPRSRTVMKAAEEILSERGLTAEKEALSELVSLAGGDLLGIAHEADKLSSFVETGAVSRETVERLGFPNAEHTVYPFYDRLGERRLPASLAALANLDDDPTWILSGAIRHLTRLTMIRLLLDRKATRKRIGELVGIPDWLASRLIGQAKRQPLDRLAASLEHAIRLDLEVKAGRLAATDALLDLALAVTSPPPE